MTMLITRCAVLAIGCLSFIASASAAAPKTTPATGATAASGYLEMHQRQYTPQNCTHNGNTALCTFSLVNRGNPVTLHAWPGDLRIVQLVDSSHVPHNAARAYFVDSSGTHQPQLVLQAGDQGSLVVEFPNVDSNSTTSEFHLGSQIVGGGSATGSASTAATTPGTAATAASTAAAPASGSQATAAATPAKTASATPAASTTTSAAAAAATEAAACAANSKSAACRAELQEQRVCAKNANSAACKNATAHAQKVESAAK